MKSRHWTNEQKLQVVLQGLKGQSVSHICNEFGIGQSLYYKWRDQFLTNASQAFESKKKPSEQLA